MSPPKTPPSAPEKAAAKPPRSADKPKSLDLGLVERRRSTRPLPVPDAVESQGDTDWAVFQALSNDPSEKP